MRAAFYARKSTKKQSAASIPDQLRNCQKRADQEGLSVVASYKDEAISGAKADRPGYLAMQASAKAGEFDLLAEDDLSRLSRDEVEVKIFLREMEYIGVRVIGVSDGYDSGTKAAKTVASMRGMMNDIYLDDLRDKTHRGPDGQGTCGSEHRRAVLWLFAHCHSRSPTDR